MTADPQYDLTGIQLIPIFDSLASQHPEMVKKFLRPRNGGHAWNYDIVYDSRRTAAPARLSPRGLPVRVGGR
ncbi:hypothetical protein [Krasilnikovia sp. MM14-A1259]|uniref:hypothetical protein n=1 Tax=Krasilnikovia sp. MM14-A1259 TaxID=3373539 RepID=UPI003802F558